MAVTYNPRIVTDGLVLCLDAANPKSYPGSGTTWTDLSGGGNTGTLINGPTYTSANGGAIVFDGSNEHSRTSTHTIPTTSDVTIFCWCYVDSALQPADPFTGLVSWGGRSDATPSNSTTLSFRTDVPNWTVSSAYWFNDFTTTDSAVELNKDQWNLVGMIARSAPIENNTTLFKFNSNGYGSVTGSSANYTRGISRTAGNLTIGCTNATGNRPMKGRIADVLVYSRELTAAEVRQNFNATRSRYGI